ncbi:MAG: hypothetical protein ABI923_08585 [bacterium]
MAGFDLVSRCDGRGDQVCINVVTLQGEAAAKSGKRTLSRIEKGPSKGHNSVRGHTPNNRPFETAKPLFIGSIPIAASKFFNNLLANHQLEVILTVETFVLWIRNADSM